MVVAPSVAFVGLESVMTIVSLASAAASLTTVRLMFWVVTDGLKVSVP